MEDRKIIGITMGDPASIGPEITVKALADQSIYEARDHRRAGHGSGFHG